MVGNSPARTFFINESSNKISLTQELETFVDESASMAISDVMVQNFTINKREIPHYSWSHAAVWVRFGLKNETDNPLEKLLHINVQFIDSISTYVDDGNQVNFLQLTGRLIPYNKRPLKYRDFVVPVHLKPEEKIFVYQRLKSTEAFTAPIILRDPADFRSYYHGTMFNYGIFYGITLTVLLSVFVLFLLSREYIYLYYCFFLVFLHFFFTMGGQGLSQKFLFPNSPDFANKLYLSSMSIGFIFGFLLIRYFQPYKFKHEILNKLFWIQLGVIGVISTLPFIFGYMVGSIVLTSYAIIPVLTILAIITTKALRGNIASCYFMLAWVFHLAGGMTIVFHSRGLVSNPFIANYGYLFGLSGELIMISIAMAVSIYLDRKKKVESQKMAYVSMKQSMESKIRELQAQIKPHFLFNILNSISQIIKKDPDLAEQSISALSDFYRSALKFSQGNVRLEEELECARLYVSLQKIRYGEKIAYDCVVEESVKKILVPGFILQPLVENAVKYGISSLPQGGTIQVRAVKEGDMVIITVKDNGLGLKQDSHGSGHGLSNVKQRLRLTYGLKAGLDIYSKKGVTVKLTVPFRVNINNQT
ncbi:MAG: histidine kinase [Fibrobacteria bacterium]|nr:histidine kinase [Fibrobacteria bacterium]